MDEEYVIMSRDFYKITLVSLGIVGILLGLMIVILNDPPHYLFGIEMFIVPVVIAIRVRIDRMKESHPGEQNSG